MLIIEGADLVGKTTLARMLLESAPLTVNGYVYSHLSRLPNGFHRHWGYVQLASRLVVQDRFHMSEVVYAQVRDEGTELTPERYRLVDAALRRLGAFTVVVTAKADIIKNRFVREREMYSVEQCLRANELFSEIVMLRLGNYKMDVDYHLHVDEDATLAFLREVIVPEILARYTARQDALSRELGQQPRKY